MNLCIVIFSLAIMGYTTAFTPPFQATLPKARSAKSRVTMSMSSPGGNNDDGDGGTTNQKSRVTMSSPGGNNDDGDGGGKNAIEMSDATILNKYVFQFSVYFCICVIVGTGSVDMMFRAVVGLKCLRTNPIELPIGTIQPAVFNTLAVFLFIYVPALDVLWSTTIGT